MKRIKQFAIVGAIALMAIVAQAKGGTVTLAWDLYSQPTTNQFVDQIKLYAVPGSNTVFTVNNSNALYSATVPVTSTNYQFTNLYAGWWTFTATAVISTNGLASANATPVWTNVPLIGVLNFKVIGSSP